MTYQWKESSFIPSQQEVWYALKNTLNFWDKETRDKLTEIKKDIIKECITTMKKGCPKIDDKMQERIESYLLNDWSIEDMYQDIFRLVLLSISLPKSITEKLIKIKGEISSLTELPTPENLSSLKSEVIGLSSVENIWDEIQDNTEWNVWHSEIPQDSPEISEQENQFVKLVYERASKQIWKPYTRWWKSPDTWFDCSGLWYRAFKEEWINFSQRLNAHAFSDADVDLRKDQVKPWDFMFWDQKPWWKKKHDSIYHIEMIISKPYTRNWKTYVRTLWSSTDAKDDCGNYVGKWVQIREREMKDYRHYGRPTYYYQLAQHERTWSSNNLIAWANTPSQELQNQVLAS